MNSNTLAQKVRATAEDNDIVDPHEVSEKVLASMTPSEMQDALAVCLPDYCQRHLSNVRRYLQKQAASSRSRAARSSKVEQYRDYWGELLRSSIFVDGTYKALGEVTAQDCEWLAEFRLAEAEKNKAEAAKFSAMGSALSACGAGTVAELPRESVPEEWGGPQ